MLLHLRWIIISINHNRSEGINLVAYAHPISYPPRHVNVSPFNNALTVQLFPLYSRWASANRTTDHQNVTRISIIISIGGLFLWAAAAVRLILTIILNGHRR